MTGPEFPVPPGLTLPPSADDEVVRAAVTLLDQDRRLGSWDQPLFLAVESGRVRISYLGLTDASGKWLEDLAGVPFADEVRTALQRFLLGPDPGSPLPPDPADQVVAATRLIAAGAPDASLRLAVTPLGLGPDSGSGLAHSSDPETGAPGMVGSFLAGGTGSQLLDSGGVPIDDLAPEPWLTELRSLLDAAEERTGRPIRAEFVIENGRLWVLSARPSVLHGAALVRATARCGGNGEARPGQAVMSVSEDEFARALAPHAAVSGLPLAGRGLGVSPGIGSGTAEFSAAGAVRARAEGHSPVLLLEESRPEDLDGLLAAAAIVTQRGGYTSHAAIVTRGLGVPCVTALHGAVVVQRTGLLLADGTAIVAGDQITVDGSSGLIYRGAPPGVAGAGDGAGVRGGGAGTRSGVAGAGDGAGVRGGGAGAPSEAGGSPRAPGARWREVEGATALLRWAGEIGGLEVRVNADSAADALRGIDAGATGVGLCRIEHMLLGDRQKLLEQLLLAPVGPQATQALDQLRELLRADFTAILTAMDDRPVAVRLLDPPRHEFLPDPAGTARAAEGGDRGQSEGGDCGQAAPGLRLAAGGWLSERNPMLGIRGVRLNLLMMELAAAQLQALVEATAAVRRAGGAPRPELLVPMVSAPAEIDPIRRLLLDIGRLAGRAARQSPIPVGAMIETPRAALLAGELAARADFLSIGTNDLTALVWGLSRDDAESQLLPAYRDLGIVDRSPFRDLDIDGVGALLRQATGAARAVNPRMTIGVCGEHAASARAASFLARIGVDYVSCATTLVPVARLACARAAISTEER